MLTGLLEVSIDIATRSPPVEALPYVRCLPCWAQPGIAETERYENDTSPRVNNQQSPLRVKNVRGNRS